MQSQQIVDVIRDLVATVLRRVVRQHLPRQFCMALAGTPRARPMHKQLRSLPIDIRFQRPVLWPFSDILARNVDRFHFAASHHLMRMSVGQLLAHAHMFGPIHAHQYTHGPYGLIELHPGFKGAKIRIAPYRKIIRLRPHENNEAAIECPYAKDRP